MRIPQHTKLFRKNYARLKCSGRRDMKKLDAILAQLICGQRLELIHKDHQLKGKWKAFRDCHIEGDWVLIYQLTTDEQGNEVIIFRATGSHSHLFG